MGIFEALILGLIQGLTEFIPVSSSAHLLIAHEVLGGEKSTLVFDVALHVGTLLALFIYFGKDLLAMAKNIGANNTDGKLARLLIVATIPAVAAGLLFSGYIDENLRTPSVIVITLALGGVIMFAVDHLVKSKKSKEVSKKQGIAVGFAQAVALIPGVSRSGITITAGMLVGMTRARAARFSFLLAIPIIAGSALGIFLKEPDGLSTGSWQIMVGVTAAFLSGLIAIKFLLGAISKAGLKPFAVYRIILAAIVFMTLV